MIYDILPVNVYKGNNSATTFDFDFYIDNVNQINVFHYDSKGNKKQLVLDVDYSINEIKNKNGSYIIFPLSNSTYSVLSDNETISLELILPISQESQYTNSSKLNLDNLEYSLDYLTRICQIMNRQLQRAAKVPEGSDVDSDELSTNINILAKNSENISSMAEDLVNIDVIADNLENINTLKDSIDNINNVGESIEKVNRVSGSILDIHTVAEKITNVDNVGRYITSVNNVANDLLNIDRVGTNLTNINKVASDITSVKNVSESINDVKNVSHDLNMIYDVWQDSVKINAVADDLANINAVSANKNNIDTTAASINNVNNVGNDIANVNAIANDLDNINAVSSNKNNIDTVASSINNINKAADNVENLNAKEDKFSVGNGLVFQTPHWEEIQITNAPGEAQMLSVAYGNNKFVAVGTNGYIATSKNGVSFEYQKYDKFENISLDNVIFDGNKFIALSGSSRYITTSVDGVEWNDAVYIENLTPSNSWGDNYDGFAYGNGIYVVLGQLCHVSTSSDGINWTVALQNENLHQFYDGHFNGYSALVFGNGKFVALGEEGLISTSSNGINWTVAQKINELSNYSWQDLVFDGVEFVALSTNGYISVSEDGINWSIPEKKLSSYSWWCLGWGRNYLIALANTYNSQNYYCAKHYGRYNDTKRLLELDIDTSNLQSTNNLVTELDLTCTDIQYPSAKAVYDEISKMQEKISDNLEADIQTVISAANRIHTFDNAIADCYEQAQIAVDNATETIRLLSETIGYRELFTITINIPDFEDDIDYIEE